jgi:hypothetical protein
MAFFLCIALHIVQESISTSLVNTQCVETYGLRQPLGCDVVPELTSSFRSSSSDSSPPQASITKHLRFLRALQAQ